MVTIYGHNSKKDIKYIKGKGYRNYGWRIGYGYDLQER